jgi:hypothetical protein
MLAILHRSLGLPVLRYTELRRLDNTMPSDKLLAGSVFVSFACDYKALEENPREKHLRSISVSTLDTRELSYVYMATSLVKRIVNVD